MQPSVTLSQKDIARFNKAVTRLAELGSSLLKSAANSHQPVVRRRRRRRMKAVEVPSKAVSANGRRKRHTPPDERE